jgi:hypothetical protein
MDRDHHEAATSPFGWKSPFARRFGSVGKRVSAAVAFCTVSVLWGCRQAPEEWTPVLEHTSTVFLETEADRAIDAVGSAMAEMEADPAAALDDLRRAETTLQYLKEFYLPLFGARERSYNAFRYFRLGDLTAAERELELIEESLASMAERAGGGPHQEIQALAQDVATARIGIRGTSAEAASTLEALARRLDQIVLKGDLVTGSG